MGITGRRNFDYPITIEESRNPIFLVGHFFLEVIVKEDDLEWYLPDEKGVSPIGPFQTKDIREKISGQKIYFDDFLSCPSFKNDAWLRTFEFPHFSDLMAKRPICPPPKLLSKGVHKKTKDPEEFYREIRDPQKLTGSFIIHNNKTTLKGDLTFVATDFVKGISPKSNLFKKGDEVSLTVYNSRHVRPFTVLTAIIEKEVKQEGEEYKFFFIRINPEVKRRINNYLLQGTL